MTPPTAATVDEFAAGTVDGFAAATVGIAVDEFRVPATAGSGDADPRRSTAVGRGGDVVLLGFSVCFAGPR